METFRALMMSLTVWLMARYLSLTPAAIRELRESRDAWRKRAKENHSQALRAVALLQIERRERGRA